MADLNLQGIFPTALSISLLLLAWPALAFQGPPATIVPSDGEAYDFFGHAVGISGNTVVASATHTEHGQAIDAGSVYVYVPGAAGWSEQAQVTSGDHGDYDLLGFSVAIDGDTMVAGAIYHQPGVGLDEAGSAYVFKRSGGGWIQEAKLVAGDPAPSAWFGHAVAVSGDSIIVGAPGADVGAFDMAGKAYVFARSGSAWTEQAQLSASDPGTFNQFGSSVTISGNTAVVATTSSYPSQAKGSAYVFAGPSWTEQAKLSPGGADFGDLFGLSVAASGDTILVGAQFDDEAGLSRGSAYVYARGGGEWTEQAKLTASDRAAGDRLGFSAAISGDVVVLGAPFEDNAAGNNAGSAYLFERGGGAWSERAKLVHPSGAAGDQFGWAVDVAPLLTGVVPVGHTVAVGALYDDTIAETDAGSVHTFRFCGPDVAAAPAALGAACDRLAVA